jgi:hypothetical protein
VYSTGATPVVREEKSKEKVGDTLIQTITRVAVLAQPTLSSITKCNPRLELQYLQAKSCAKPKSQIQRYCQ